MCPRKRGNSSAWVTRFRRYRAVEAALEQVPPSAAGTDGNEPTIAQRRADALGLVADSALAGELDPGNPGDRFQVTVHVPADTLCLARAGHCTAARFRGNCARQSLEWGEVM